VDTLGFQFVKRRCQPIVSRVQAAPASTRSGVVGNDGEVLTESPLRMAFDERSSGFCTYRRIVYDPTTLVMNVGVSKQSGPDRDNPDLARLRKLLGVHLYSVEPLGGPWYRCDFDEDKGE
jgi:hypothetical protein